MFTQLRHLGLCATLALATLAVGVASNASSKSIPGQPIPDPNTIASIPGQPIPDPNTLASIPGQPIPDPNTVA